MNRVTKPNITSKIITNDKTNIIGTPNTINKLCTINKTNESNHETHN